MLKQDLGLASDKRSPLRRCSRFVLIYFVCGQAGTVVGYFGKEPGRGHRRLYEAPTELGGPGLDSARAGGRAPAWALL